MERVNFFNGQLLTADDLRTEQEYLRGKRRLHNQNLHGWGVVSGLVVVAPGDDDPPTQVTIEPGYAITPGGDEICVGEPIRLDTAAAIPRGAPLDESLIVYVALRYTETPIAPVPIPSDVADESALSRIRESFDVEALADLPESHRLTDVSCPPTDDPWVVLAAVRLSGDQAVAITNRDITYGERRSLRTTR